MKLSRPLTIARCKVETSRPTSLAASDKSSIVMHYPRSCRAMWRPGGDREITRRRGNWRARESPRLYQFQLARQTCGVGPSGEEETAGSRTVRQPEYPQAQTRSLVGPQERPFSFHSDPCLVAQSGLYIHRSRRRSRRALESERDDAETFRHRKFTNSSLLACAWPAYRNERRSGRAWVPYCRGDRACRSEPRRSDEFLVSIGRNANQLAAFF